MTLWGLSPERLVALWGQTPARRAVLRRRVRRLGRWDGGAGQNLPERAGAAATADDGQRDRRDDRERYEDRHPGSA
jgi:hypothetical protein